MNTIFLIVPYGSTITKKDAGDDTYKKDHDETGYSAPHWESWHP